MFSFPSARFFHMAAEMDIEFRADFTKRLISEGFSERSAERMAVISLDPSNAALATALDMEMKIETESGEESSVTFLMHTKTGVWFAASPHLPPDLPVPAILKGVSKELRWQGCDWPVCLIAHAKDDAYFSEELLEHVTDSDEGELLPLVDFAHTTLFRNLYRALRRKAASIDLVFQFLLEDYKSHARYADAIDCATTLIPMPFKMEQHDGRICRFKYD